MPFAGYQDFAACVAAQQKKGHTKEEAEKICGYLEAQAKKRREIIEEQIKAASQKEKVD